MLPVESWDVALVERLLCKRRTHLRARKYGTAVIIESGPAGDTVKHLRLRRDTVHLWRLDVANHAGAWQPTPMRAALEEIIRTVITDFPWTLQKVL